MPSYDKQVQAGSDRFGNPTYITVPTRYKKKNRRSRKSPRKASAGRGNAASRYSPSSSSSTFFTALAIPKK